MKLSTLLTWIPRVLSIILTLVLYGFLFQFTPEGFEWPNFIYALIPGTVLFLLTVFSWLFPKFGGILFVVLGAGYAVYAYNQVALTAILILSGISIVSGILYFLQKPEKRVEKVPEEAEKRVEEEEKPEMEKEAEEAAPSKPETVAIEPKMVKGEKELPPLPPKVMPEEKDFLTKEPPGAETPPLGKSAEPEPPARDKLPSWKGPKADEGLPDISLTSERPSISGDDLEKKNSKNQAGTTGKKTNGPSQEFMKWVEKQNLK